MTDTNYTDVDGGGAARYMVRAATASTTSWVDQYAATGSQRFYLVTPIN